ncbi:endonuclease domain-containing 1 protein-like [Melospiza melodia melodia]|uniref:endonuclease domain-containing 1 protein-like n=1 Tax=Melospiza melodia melodia TaxID=1914991 RepID=UPI002FD6976C
MLGLLLLLQVLASCLWLGHSTVETPFLICPQFFYDGIPPNNALNPQNPAWICQRFRNSFRYATLYDRDRKIPVYSAYIFQPRNTEKPPEWWMVEPQVSNVNIKEMERESDLIAQHHFTLDQIEESQAVLDDYKGLKDLDFGHLIPSDHMESLGSKMATFTLTNVVPQDSSLNKGQWNIYQSKTMPKMTKGCTTTYVITGAVPGSTDIAVGRVNRPSHIWSAACCVVGTEPTSAWGAIAENNKNEVVTITLGELEERLTNFYGRKVILFEKACPRQ